MKQLIINSDDFGIDADRDRGIILGVYCRTITSVSVIVTNHLTAYQVKMLKKMKSIASLGLHINLTDSPLLTCNAINLYETDYIFPKNKHTFWKNCISDTIILSRIQDEIDAQYQLFTQLLGFEPMFLDAHNHCFVFHKKIFEYVIRIANITNIPVRVPYEIFELQDVLSIPWVNVDEVEYLYSLLSGDIDENILHNFDLFIKYDMVLYNIMCVKNTDMSHNINFVGTIYGHIRQFRYLLNMLSTLQGVTIFMVHPGLYNPFIKHNSPFSSIQRVKELTNLLLLRVYSFFCKKKIHYDTCQSIKGDEYVS